MLHALTSGARSLNFHPSEVEIEENRVLNRVEDW